MRQAGLLRVGMTLLGGIAIRQPDRRSVPLHHVPDHDGAARRRRVMDHGIVAAEHPMKRIAALDADAGLVRGDHFGLAEHRESIVALGHKSSLRPAEHVHQAALADGQSEEMVKGALQTLVGQGLEGLEIGGDRVEARAERRAFRRRGHRRNHQRPTRGTTNRQTPMALDEGLDHGKLDLVVLADDLGRQIAGQRHAATRAFIGMMVDDPIDILAQAG